MFWWKMSYGGMNEKEACYCVSPNLRPLSVRDDQYFYLTQGRESSTNINYDAVDGKMQPNFTDIIKQK